MSIPTLSRLAAKVAGKLPLPMLLIVAFVVQILGTVGLVEYLSFKSGQEAAERVADRLMDEVDEGVEQNRQDYLDVLSIVALIGCTGMSILTARWITKLIPCSNTAAKNSAKTTGEPERDTKERVTQWLGITQDSSARQQAEATLRQSELKFATIFQDNPQPAWIATLAEGRILDVNERFSRFLGYSHAEAIGKTCVEMQLWNDLADLHHFRQTLLQTGSIQDFEVVFRTRSGAAKTILLAARVSRLNDQHCVIGVLSDISDRKLAEIALKQSETRFLEISDSSPANIYILVRRVDGSFYFEHMSRAIETIHEIPIEQILENANILLERIHPEDRAGYEAAVKHSLENLQPFQHEWRVINPSGKIKWLQGSSRPKPREKGEIAWHGVVIDISDRKQAEAALKAKTEELDRVFCAALDLLCIANTDGYFLRLNPQWEKTLGYRLEDLQGAKFLDYVHPDDFDSTLDAIALLTNRQEVPNFVNRYRCRDGSYRWIEWCSVPVGNLIYAAARDISDKKQVEEAIQQQKEILQTIFDNLPVLLCFFDTNVQIQLVNPAFEQILGWSLAELQAGIDILAECYPDPEYRASVAEFMIAADGTWRDFELRTRTAQTLAISWANVRLPDGSTVGIGQDISDRKRAELALRESEERFNLAMSGTNDGIWDIDLRTNQAYHSPVWLQILGYGEGELPALMSTWLERIHPDDLPQVLADFQEHLDGKTTMLKNIHRLQHKESHWVWIETKGRCLRDSSGNAYRTIGTITDISDKKLAEQQLQWKETLLRSMTDTSPLAFYVVDNRTDAILYFNPRFCEIWGIEHFEERMQQGVLKNNDIIPDCLPMLKDVEAFAESCKPLQSEENRIVIEDEIPFADGRTIRRFSAQIRDTRDRYFGRLYIFEDITERKQSQVALQQAVIAAEMANRAKSQFLANMSHELRTPLNGILGYAQILQRDKNASPKQKEGTDIIYQCGSHLLMLINDILDLSKIEAGKLELYPDDFNFLSFLQGIYEIFRLKAAQKSIDFIYFAANQLPTIVHADEKRLRQVLMNLLSNAVKFTDTGSVTFKIEVIGNGSWEMGNRDKSYQLPITNNQLPIAKIRFHVEDTGIGMTSEQLAKIFLPFE